MFSKGIGELSRLLEAKEISSREICTALLERIDKIEPRIHAFISVNPETVMEAAEQFFGQATHVYKPRRK